MSVNVSYPSADIGLIEIDEPGSHNALSPNLCSELVKKMKSCEADLACRAIVLTGGGAVFSAGADLGGRDATKESLLPALQSVMRTIETLSVPVVAAVNGPAVGAGVQLCLASDVRVIAPGAYFQVPAISIGLTVDSWTVRKTVALVGAARAQTLLLTGKKLSSEEAFTIGFGSVQGDLTHALEVAAAMAASAPATLTHLKLSINSECSEYVSSGMVDAADAAVWSSPEFQAGVAAASRGESISFRGVSRIPLGTVKTRPE